jgi:hypothetical protein
MLARNKFLIFLFAIILIPILLGMIPLNFVQKMGSGCPLNSHNPSLKCNPCPFNSIVSNEIPGNGALPSMFFIDEDSDFITFKVFNPHTITSDNSLPIIPLRC